MRARTRYVPETGSIERDHAVPSKCGKLAYATMKRAKNAAAIARRDTGETIEAYHCWSPCHAFHIGHPPAPYDPQIHRNRLEGQGR